MITRLIIAVACILAFTCFGAFGESVGNFDDFETGPMPLMTNPAGPPQQFVQAGLPPLSCLAGERTVLIHAQASAAIPPGTIDDRLISKAASPLPGPAPLTTVRYEFSPGLDLTGGGQHDRMRFEVGPVSGSLLLRVHLYAPGAPTPNATATVPVSAAGIYMLPYSQFAAPLVLLQNVAKVEIETGSAGPGGPYELHLRRVVLTGQNVTQPLFELPEEILTLVGTNVPARSIMGCWTNPLDSSPLHNHIDLVIDNVDDGSSGIFPGKLEYGDTEGPGGNGGLLAGLTMQTSDGSFGPGNLAFSFNFVPNGHTELLQIDPVLSVVSSSLIRIDFSTDLYVTAKRGGLPVGTNNYQILIENGPGGENTFVNPLLSGGFGGDHVGLAFDIENLGGQTGLECTPAFSISLASSFVPAPASTATQPSMSALGMLAQPTVTSGTTVFHLSAPLSRSDLVQLFDLRGRLVGELSLGRGTVSQSWDGRDLDGRPLASGVYFARLLGDPRANTRITIVR